MKIEVIIDVIVYGTTIIALLLFVPKHRIREAEVVYLFKLFLTWLLGLFVVEMRWIEYPKRLIFPHAHKSNFTFEFFVYPSICVLFNLHYPWKKNYVIQFGYFAAYCSIMTLLEVLIERYTNLIHYIKWTWYWTWITLFLTFFLSRLYYLWYFKLKNKQPGN